MKLSNFHINDNIALNYKEQYLDIHNNYDFRGFSFDTVSNLLELKWTRSHEKWAKEKFCGFKLVFYNVTFLKISERNMNVPFTEDNCMTSIYFSPQNRRDNFDNYAEGSNFKIEDDLNITFQSEQAFKINSVRAELVELNEEIIYVPMLDEGTNVWRPMWADRLEAGIYYIKSFPTYDATVDALVFNPGEIVICERQELSNGRVLVAIKNR